jgi:hypothetical protein
LYRSPLGFIDRGLQQILKPLNVSVYGVGEGIHRRDQAKLSRAKAIVSRLQRALQGAYDLRLKRVAEPILFKIAHSEPVPLSLASCQRPPVIRLARAYYQPITRPERSTEQFMPLTGAADQWA